MPSPKGGLRFELGLAGRLGIDSGADGRFKSEIPALTVRRKLPVGRRVKTEISAKSGTSLFSLKWPCGNQSASWPQIPNGRVESRYLLYFALFYGVIVAIYFNPLFGSAWQHKLLGTSQWAPDNILNAGILEWGWRSLWAGQFHVFDWVAGFPMKNSLAGTENLIGWQVFYSPLRVLGVGTVAAMNTLVCLSFVISATGGAAFARHVGLGKPAALCAGLVFAFAPAYTVNMIQFQSLAVCWIPWSLVFIDRFAKSGKWPDFAAASLAGCMALLSGMYIGICLCITVAIWIPVQHVFGMSLLSRAAMLRVLAVALASGLLVSPVLIRYLRFNHEHGLTLSVSYMTTHSLPLLHLVKPSGLLSLWSIVVRNQAGGASGGFFPGIIILVLFVAGLWTPVVSKRWKLSLLVVGLVLGVLACGPFLKIANSPIRLAGFRVPLPGLLLRLIPGVRVPFRLILPASLFFSVLCGAGVTSFTSRFGRKALSVIVLGLFAELYPASSLVSGAVNLPPPSEIAQAYQHLEGCHASVELPVPEPEAGPHELLSRYVYGASAHLHPVVSYYASIWPKEVWRLQRLASRLPSDAAREILVESGVNCAVLHRTPLGDKYPDLLDAFVQAGYPLVFRGEDSAVILLSRPREEGGNILSWSTKFQIQQPKRTRGAP